MKSVFEEYSEFWPAERRKVLAPILSKVYVLQYPRDQHLIGRLEHPSRDVIVVSDNAPLQDLIRLFGEGFEHCVQKNREDFMQEMLTSSFMSQRPQVFSRDPITFFFNGFQSIERAAASGRHLQMNFRSTAQKPTLLSKLRDFLGNSPGMESIRDICIQAADELIHNAIFSAPVALNGTKINEAVPRNQQCAIPDGRHATLFASCSDQKVLIGCNDPFGSLSRATLLLHLRNSFKDEPASVRTSGPGAGLGFKYMIENSANFYVMVTKGSRTLVTCGFLLKGMKANLSETKHFHLSFR